MLALLLLAFVEPQCPAARPAPPPAHESKAAAKKRESKAQTLAQSADQKLRALHFAAAVEDAKAAMDLTPQDHSTLCLLYHSLGSGYVYSNRRDEGEKWMLQFWCGCPEARAGVRL